VVVARRVEPLSLSAKERRIEFGVQDAFLVVEGPGEVRAVGCEDRAAASSNHVEPLEFGTKGKIVRV
jgi:hypothetical protein